MPRKIKKLAHMLNQLEESDYILPIAVKDIYINHRDRLNYIDVPHAFVVEWSEYSEVEHGIEPSTYSIYCLNEDKAKSIFFDLIFGLRNSESWSIHVPHCPNRKVKTICIELTEKDKEISTNSLYCEWLEWKAKDWFEDTLINNENNNE